MKRLIKYTAFNGMFVAAMYFGFYEGHEGARNLAYFAAWFCIVISFILTGPFSEGCPDKLKLDIAAKHIKAWRNIDICFDIVVACVFVFYGGIVTGIFYILHIFITSAVYSHCLEIANDHTEK